MKKYTTLCKRIIDNGALTEQELLNVLEAIARGGKRKSPTPRAILKDDKYWNARATSMNYRAKKKQVSGTVTGEQIRQLMLKQPRCQRCGSDKNLQIDHIQEISRGGTNTIDNMQVLCAACNMDKGPYSK